MNKKIFITSLASSLFLAQAANAEFKVGNIGTLSFTAGVQSSYISKGVDQNSDRPAYNAAIDFVAPTSIVDFYAGYFKISATGADYTWEDTRYAGIRKIIGSVTLDASLVETLKSGNGVTVQNNDVDFTYKASFAPDKAPYTLGLVYTQNDTNGSKSGIKTIGKYYQEINGSYNFGFATAGISYGENKNDVDITTIKLTKSFMDAEFTISYIDAQRKGAAGTGSNLDKDREYLTLGVSKTF
jgi:uncharacterized protein (TIGR02001 family)